MKNARRRSAFYRIGKRLWCHPSVLGLVQQFNHLADPEDIIRGRARQLIADARAYGWTGPPFDPRVLASILGIKVRAEHLVPGHEAFIYPAKGQQLEIIFDQTRPTTRQNFSICHEIAHTLFPDHFEMIRNRYQHRESFDPDRELEYLCDVGAAELLLPEDEFREDIDRLGFTLDAVIPLRARYDASREAVIRRMVQVDPGRSAAVFLEYRLKPSELASMNQLSFVGSTPTRVLPKLRIAYAVPSRKFGVFLPPHKSIPNDSCAYRALETGDIENGSESWDIRGLPLCNVEAMSLPPGDGPDASLKAVAVLRI